MAYHAKETATERTAEAQAALQALREVLVSSLSESTAVDWERLKDRTRFPKPVPAAPNWPAIPEQTPIAEAPLRTSPRYQPDLGVLDKLIPSRRREKKNWKAALFESDSKTWETERDRVLAEYAAKTDAYQRQFADLEAAHAKAKVQWEAERTAFMTKQNEQHQAMDA